MNSRQVTPHDTHLITADRTTTCLKVVTAQTTNRKDFIIFNTQAKPTETTMSCLSVTGKLPQTYVHFRDKKQLHVSLGHCSPKLCCGLHLANSDLKIKAGTFSLHSKIK